MQAYTTTECKLDPINNGPLCLVVDYYRDHHTFYHTEQFSMLSAYSLLAIVCFFGLNVPAVKIRSQFIIFVSSLLFIGILSIIAGESVLIMMYRHVDKCKVDHSLWECVK